MSTQADSWKRLTREQVVNFVIVSLILEGIDDQSELLPDGDPGPFLERTIRDNLIDWPTVKREHEAVSSSRIFLLYAIYDIAEKVGYDRTRPLEGFVDYLRNLPTEGPIG